MLGALVGWTIAACDDAPTAKPSLAPTPISKNAFVEDLLETSEGSPGVAKSMSSVLRARTSLPPDATLKLAGGIWPSDSEAKTTGPATFAVELGGVEIFSRQLKTGEEWVRFQADVPLSRFGGQTVDLTLRIERERPDHDVGEWERATIYQRMTIPRLAASHGRNLLLLLVDTLRADRCSLYGYFRKTTPNLDSFAGDALVFENAISPSSWTIPSVASLLTGLYPHQHGVNDRMRLNQSLWTLAERLQEEGFTTLGVSSNPLIDSPNGYDQGFETFHHRPWERARKLNELLLEWLDGHSDLRWFAFVHYIDPHDPYDAPPPEGRAFLDRSYRGIFMRPKALNELFRTVNFGHPAPYSYGDEDLAYLEAAYDGEILYWDRHFGQLMKELRRRDLEQNTVVIVTSDHGEEFTEHGMFKHGMQLFDESVRVPLVIRAPGLVASNRRRVPVETRGIMRAATQLMELSSSSPRPDDLLQIADGDSWPTFIHTLRKKEPGQPRELPVVAVRDSDWKLIHWRQSGRSELFNLLDDPRESRNVLASRSEVGEKYLEFLRQWFERAPPAEEAKAPRPLNPETIEKLRSLGYVR